ncbi:MAG: hypothetical protein FWD66_11315 [Paludibacter sp.]|nr:hypothetical protein [Paludibacter sp.]
MRTSFFHRFHSLDRTQNHPNGGISPENGHSQKSRFDKMIVGHPRTNKKTPGDHFV